SHDSRGAEVRLRPEGLRCCSIRHSRALPRIRQRFDRDSGGQTDERARGHREPAEVVHSNLLVLSPTSLTKSSSFTPSLTFLSLVLTERDSLFASFSPMTIT